MSAPPVDSNENALPAKESGFEELTNKLNVLTLNYILWFRKPFLSFESNRTVVSDFLLRTVSSIHYAVSSLELARHFRMSQSAARQIGYTQRDIQYDHLITYLPSL